MNRYFEIGNRFSLDGADGEYEVKEIVGKGASCIVYRTTFTNKNGVVTEHLLKEYNPSRLNVVRDDNKFLSVPEEELSDFKAGMERFVSGYQLQLEIRQKIREVTNSTSNIQEVYSDYGTKYIDMTLFHGETYGNVQEKSLYDLLRRAKSITQVIGSYHKAGYLHLDIKPDNIFTIPETCELVMLFDFDSVTEKSQLMNRTGLSYTQSWAAPEQISLAQKKKICEATDLFPIGEMVFYQIYGRHSMSEEQWSFCDYEFDLETPIFKNVNPKVFPLLTELLHKTICVSVKERYQSADELIEKLDKLIKLADPKEPFLVGTVVAPEAFFIGRDTELAEIHTQLQQNHTLFLSGIGGIGKSELAKNYAKNCSDDYDTVLFAAYNGSWLMLINDDTNIHIANFERFTDEKEQDYYRRKIRKLKELCDAHTLFIIDNLDEDEFEDEAQKQLEDILGLGCKLLITTRLREWSYPVLDVSVFSDAEHLVHLFNQYYKIENDTDMTTVREIIDYVGKHTLTVELIAKQTSAGFLSPAEMLEKLKEHGISQSGKEKVVSDKDNAQSRKTAFDHISALFDIAKLKEEDKYVLANMSLIPPDGIPAKLFKEWCELEDFDAVNSLVGGGWLDRDGDKIKMHPVVAEVAIRLLKEESSKCENMIRSITIIAEEQENQKIIKSASDSLQNYIGLFNGISHAVLKNNITSEFIACFLYTIAPVIYKYGFLHEAIDSGLQAIKSCEKFFGEENSKTSDAYHNLGLIYFYVGDTGKATKLLQKALKTRRKLHGDDKCAEVAESYVALGMVLENTGELEAAERYTQRAVFIYADLYGENHERTATAINDLGHVYWSNGSFSLSEEYYKNALKILQKIYGQEHRYIAVILNNLGVLFSDIGDLETAEYYFQSAYEMRLNLFGENNSDTTESLCSLADVYKDKEDFPNAEKYYLRAIDAWTKLYGEMHPNSAYGIHSLAMLYCEKEDWEKAERYCRKALSIRLQVLGKEHPDTIISFHSLGFILYHKGEYELAECHYRTVLEYRKKQYGEIHPDTANVINNLAVLYDDMQKYELAEQYYKKAETIFMELFGENNRSTAISLSNLGCFYMERGDFGLAEKYLQKAYKAFQKLFGEKHSITVKCKERLEKTKLKF